MKNKAKYLFTLISALLLMALDIVAQAPVITSFSPTSGPVGSLVTLVGNNLNAGNPSVAIGGKAALIVSNTDSSIVAMVMPGSAGGNVTVNTTAGTASSSGRFMVSTTPYPDVQRGGKLVGTGITYSSVPSNIAQGRSVAVSADGSTAIVGGPGDNNGVGAAWVYVRSRGFWIQQGSKLIGGGSSVAISADGNTAMVGNSSGSVRVYVRSGGSWAQQGYDLVPQSNASVGKQDISVSISADGNTAIVGRPGEDNNTGAAWVYVRSEGSWAQQGSKLVGTGAGAGFLINDNTYAGGSLHGFSVSLSADGNTAIVGGPGDYIGEGAAWVYVRSGSSWAQQGSKLIATGNFGDPSQSLGISVSLSADGNTAIVGGLTYSTSQDAAWVYVRRGSNWVQEVELFGGGTSVAIGADGTTAIVGAHGDNNSMGAVRVYTRSINGWVQQNQLTGTGAAVSGGYQSSSYVSLSADGSTAMVGNPGDYYGTGAAWVYVRSPYLSDLITTAGSISPAFSSTTYNYTATVANTVDAITVTPKLVSATDQVEVYGIWVANGNASPPIHLNVGANTIRIVTISQDGMIKLTYTLTVTRLPAPVITSFSPVSGPVGSLVTLVGNNLNAGDLSVTIGGKAALIVSNTDNSILAMAMPGSVSGNVSVSTKAGTASGPGNFTVLATPYPGTQQGSKLVGAGSVGGNVYQGSSIAVSADGNTAIVGGQGDNNIAGAAWVYVRSGSGWAQQGSKLSGRGVGSGNSVAISADGNTAIVGNLEGSARVYVRTGGNWAQQGNDLVPQSTASVGEQDIAVSISADGNTAILGERGDNADVGAAWVYVRRGNNWVQYGGKLVGIDAMGSALQGSSVSISADGSTAIVGGTNDNGSIGAAWVYKLGSSWIQYGSKLVGTGAVGNAFQGTSVSLSADGNTAIVGGYGDNNSTGAAWVYVLSGNRWTQQGVKLVGTGTVGNAFQGTSVSLSADGNTAIVGGYGDNNSGAAWVYIRSGGSWLQQNKLVGTSAVGNAQQGGSVSLSADGTTAIVGGPGDNGNMGAAWVYISGHNPYLSNLTTTAGSISPAFSGTTYNYTASVANAVDAITVTPTLVNATDLITVNGTGVSNGNASSPIALNVGANTITIVITAQDGVTSLTYTLTVYKASVLTAGINTITNISCNNGNNGSLAAVANGGRAPYTYSWSPGGNTNATLNGLMAGVYTVTITDANGTAATASVTLSQPQAISFNNNSLPNGTYGATYSQDITATGGTGNITYSISSGSLPAGLSLNTITGNVSGTPVMAGTYNFAVTATDVNNCSQMQNYILVINRATLTVTANNQYKTYDGLAFYGGNGVSYSGFVNGESSGVLTGSVGYAGNSQGAICAGSYTIIPSGLNAVNYSITYANGTLTINKAQLMITAPVNLSINNSPSLCGAVLSSLNVGMPAISANDCGTITITNNAPAQLPVGATVVIWTATAADGTVATALQTVTVSDNEAPVAKTKPVTVVLVNGMASITPADVNNGSTDNCSIAGMSLSKTNFTCANIGNNTVTLTVTDAHGNINSATANVTVVGALPVVAVIATPANNVFTGGVPTNLYLGYGPQSVSLSAAATGGYSFSYTWGGNANLGGTTGNSVGFAPTVAGYYTFTVIATNENGCNATSNISICVQDIKVPGTNGKQVYITHAPPGNTANAKTLAVSLNAVDAFLKNQSASHLGPVSMQPCSNVAAVNAFAEKGTVVNDQEASDKLQVKIYPNPSAVTFHLQVTGKQGTMADVRIIDMNGRIVKVYTMPTGSTIQFGNDLSAGAYFVEVQQGTQRKVTKIIKIQ